MPTFVDLSHPLEQGQLCFPGDPELSVTVHDTIATAGYNVTRISMSSHQGTHLDVPYHFFDDGKTIDQMPLDRFHGPASLVDLAPGACMAAHEPITIDMLRPHEAKFQAGAKVLVRTGWDRMFGRPEAFSDVPRLTAETARWIAQRRIGLLGMDTLTPGPEWKEVHWTLLSREADMVIVEGLRNLERLPERFTLCAFPLNIKGRDGSPVRAVAIID